jgi:hypothetical protein
LVTSPASGSRCRLSRLTDHLASSALPRHIQMVTGPLGILLRAYDLPVAHVNNLVPVLRGFRIVRDHQHGLTEFLVRLA